MFKYHKKIILVLVIGLLIFLPSLALADDLGLTSAAAKAGLVSDTDLSVVVGKVIQIALGLLGLFFTILIIYYGFLWTTAQGSSEQFEKAKIGISRAAIGIVIILAAYSISFFAIDKISTAVEGDPEAQGGGYKCCVDFDGNCIQADPSGDCPAGYNGDRRDCLEIEICN